MYSNMLRRTMEQLAETFGVLKHATSNATMNAELEIAQIWPKAPVIVLELYLLPSLFEIDITLPPDVDLFSRLL